MANENEQKKAGVTKLIYDMETLWAKMEREGLDDTATSIAAENLRKNLDYLESLPNDEDRIIFINSKGNGFKEWMFDTPSPTAGIAEVQKQLEDLGPSKKIARDERGHKTATREQVFKQMDDSATVEELTDPGDERSWYNRPTEELKANAKALGMYFGDYMNLLQSESAKYGREQAMNEPGFSGLAIRKAFPRTVKSVLETGDYSNGDFVGDVAENVLQAIPVGPAHVGKAYKLAKVLPKFARKGLGKVRKAAHNAQKAILAPTKKLPNSAVVVAQNAAVPATMEVYDSVNEDRSIEPSRIVEGAAINTATPRIIQLSLTGLNRFINMPKEINLAKKLFATNSPQMTYYTNKAGRERFASQLLGNLENAFPLVQELLKSINEKSDKEKAEKERKEQKRRQKLREDEMNEQYKSIMLSK